jgi:hypothetical protein
MKTLNFRQLLPPLLNLPLSSSSLPSSNNQDNQVQEEANSNLPTVVEITMTKSQMMTPACCEDYDDAPHKLQSDNPYSMVCINIKLIDKLRQKCYIAFSIKRISPWFKFRDNINNPG